MFNRDVTDRSNCICFVKDTSAHTYEVHTTSNPMKPQVLFFSCFVDMLRNIISNTSSDIKGSWYYVC